MKYAIISDIHANPAAFKAVLDDAGRQKADRIVCLGDITGYGYDALESYELAKENCTTWLLGNHDAACAGVDAEVLIRGNPNYDLDIAARKELGRERLAEIRKLPYTFSNSHFACSHGNFLFPQQFEYVLCVDDAIRNFAATTADLMFVGHTHDAKIWILSPDGEMDITRSRKLELQPGFRYIVDVGSVGYPRNNFFSSYALFDSRTACLELRKLDFDFSDYVAKFAKKGLALPPWLEQLHQICKNMDGKKCGKTSNPTFRKSLSIRHNNP